MTILLDEVPELPYPYSMPEDGIPNITVERAVMREILRELEPLVAHVVYSSRSSDSVGRMADEVLLLNAWKNSEYWRRS